VSVTVVRQRRAAKCGNVCLKHVAVFLARAFLSGNNFFRATGARHPRGEARKKVAGSTQTRRKKVHI
jgi:hypothetical protein